MSKELEPFAQRLRRLPLRQVPGEWRQKILSAAGETQPVQRVEVVSNHSFISRLNRRLTSMFWPHPVAWGALAAIWVCIFAVNFSSRDNTPVVAEKNATPSPEMLAELRAQRRLYLELTDANASEPDDAVRKKTFIPGPRSEIEASPSA